jgi:hypothetical protein
MKPVISPAVWRADEIGGKAGLSCALTEREFAAFEAMLAATAAKPVLEIGGKDFVDPYLAELGRHCRQELARGRGAVILTGLDPDRFGFEGYQRLYWYLGQLVGKPVLQSERGDLLGFVRQEKDNPFSRGYISNFEIGFHTDYHEILSLAAVQTASEGGESGLCSGLEVHNMLLEERPDLLAAMYEGWYDGLYSFYKKYPAREHWPNEHVPNFAEQDGLMSIHAIGSMYNDMAAQERGEEMPPLIAEIVQTVMSFAARPGVGARFVLQPGEMMFWQNWTILHARTAFTNAPGHERMLMRLWLDANEGRPTPAFIRERAKLVDRIHAEIGAENAAQAEAPQPA